MWGRWKTLKRRTIMLCIGRNKVISERKWNINEKYGNTEEISKTSGRICKKSIGAIQG